MIKFMKRKTVQTITSTCLSFTPFKTIHGFLSGWLYTVLLRWKPSGLGDPDAAMSEYVLQYSAKQYI